MGETALAEGLPGAVSWTDDSRRVAMEWLDRWDVALMLVAVYVSVMTLVRMMVRRRDQLVADVRQQLESHRKHHKKRHGGGSHRDAA